MLQWYCFANSKDISLPIPIHPPVITARLF